MPRLTSLRPDSRAASIRSESCSMKATCRQVLAPRLPVLSYEEPRSSKVPSCGLLFHSLQATSQALQPMQIDVSVKNPLRSCAEPCQCPSATASFSTVEVDISPPPRFLYCPPYRRRLARPQMYASPSPRLPVSTLSASEPTYPWSGSPSVGSPSSARFPAPFAVGFTSIRPVRSSALSVRPESSATSALEDSPPSLDSAP